MSWLKVKKIIAGTNITIDPPNGTGLVTINSSGGGSASGADGAIQFAESGAFASDETNFIWDDTNKRLGIRATPDRELHIKQAVSDVTNGIRLENANNTSNLRIWVGGSAAVIDSYDNTSLIIRTNNSNRMFFDYVTGNVGINDTSPGEKLEVGGSININAGNSYKQSGNAGVGGDGTVYTLGGGGSGDLASITVAGGIVTGVTQVP